MIDKVESVQRFLYQPDETKVSLDYHDNKRDGRGRGVHQGLEETGHYDWDD